MATRQKFLSLLAAGVLLIAALGGCAGTRHETITSIEGPIHSGVLARPLVILGILKLTTNSGNLANANQTQFVRTSVEVPVGTAVIVPSLSGWMLGFGSAQPNPANPEAEINWQTEDHNWGLGTVEVSVLKIHPPNTLTQPPTQTADISVRFYLSDDNQDDPWFGAANYTLLCLGVPGVTPGSWTPIGFEPPRLIAVPNR